MGHSNGSAMPQNHIDAQYFNQDLGISQLYILRSKSKVMVI